MSKQTNMTTGNPVKLLLSFAIPLMLGTIFQQSFIIVDRIIVGHLIGANEAVNFSVSMEEKSFR